jgi:2-iminobutanoate/2-iminopropanoate deaminase
MKIAVETGLPELNMPLEWAVVGEGRTLYTTACPVYLDGSIETEDPQKQFDLTVENIKRTVEAAGGSLDDVTLCQFFMTDAKYTEQMNLAWNKHFKAPFPNRTVVIVNGFAVPFVVECCVWAHI